MSDAELAVVIILGVVVTGTLIIELLTRELKSLCFTIAAGVSLCFGGWLDWRLVAMIFAAVSAGLYYFVRPAIKKEKRVSSEKLPKTSKSKFKAEKENPNIGKHAKLLHDVDDNISEVEIDEVVYPVMFKEEEGVVQLKEGAIVEIIGADKDVLIVRAIEL